VLAYAIRNELEPVHHGYQTRDANMPELNRRVRNTAYTVLLEQPDYAWRLSEFPRAILDAHALGAPGIRLPTAIFAPK
jgi:hypothetical protein